MLQHTQLAPGVVQILSEEGFGATLVTGERGALLFDTLSGAEPLADYVKSLTPLPVTVVNSHGHFDHTGGNCQFGRAYLNRLDWPTVEHNGALIRRLEGDLGERIAQVQAAYPGGAELLELVAGQVFDLGGATLEAVALPGHTAGSMGLLYREARLLLAGDGLTPQMCLFFPESLPAADYRRTVEHAMGLEFDHFILGHYGRLFPKALLEKLLACADLPGRAKGHAFVYTMLPEYRGTLYFLELNDEEAGGPVCIITRPAPG